MLSHCYGALNAYPMHLLFTVAFFDRAVRVAASEAHFLAGPRTRMSRAGDHSARSMAAMGPPSGRCRP